MLQVDPAHFANVATAVLRTGSLTGGAVRGLPGGAVVEGLKGINSFASDVNEAKKEFELGRVRSSLERVKQMESMFNGIASRWNGTVGSLISSTRQGRQKLPLQKLNELKNAQTKMQQLIGPASKAFQDLVTALEHAVTLEGHQQSEDAIDQTTESEPTEHDAAKDAPPTPSPAGRSDDSEEDTPERDLLGRFSSNYRYGRKLQLRRGADKKARIVPPLEKDKFYFVVGLDPPRVVRMRELNPKAILVFDTHLSCESLIEARELAELIKQGMWILV